ncbi:MAG TPA: hypothetical protein VH062_25520 [Polyangiaceae bacterium]|jgi:hypothetical protein|nr:hypothetical protein [Polyangiaceae bacterium]
MSFASRVGSGVALCALFATACGGSAPASKAPAAETTQSAAATDTKPEADSDSTSSDATGGKPAGEPVKTDSAAASDPTFPEGASVDQATAAVPKGAARSNIDADRLAEPLQQESVYEPCKVGTQHFKVRVAVWAGQAVGVDVTTSNKKLAACIDKQIRSITWPDKVHSLNTVEFSF